MKSFRENIDNFVELSKLLDFEDANLLPDKAEEIERLEDKLSNLSTEPEQKEAGHISYDVYNKIIKKLEREAVEDFRIDFEDGYGNRPNEEEDQTAQAAALEVAKGFRDETLSPFVGIFEIKKFT